MTLEEVIIFSRYNIHALDIVRERDLETPRR